MYTLVQLTDEEKQFEARFNVKIRILPTGGVVEGAPPGRGWTCYKKYIERTEEDGTVTKVFGGTGIAPVTIESATGRLVTRRVAQGACIFDSDVPAFGTFCAIRDGNLIYLWGELEGRVYLARVGIWAAIKPNLYLFWDGATFNDDMATMMLVLEGYTQGSFFRSELFGHCYNWAFVGAKQQSGNNAIIVGYSKEVAGPYSMTHVIDFEGHPTYVGSSSIYAHAWAFQQSEGQLMVTWYEEAAGSVITARLQLDMRKQA